MIKVLHTGISENYGGTEVFVYNYYEELDKEKFHVDFVTSNGSIPLEEEMLKTGAKVFKLPHLKKHPAKYFAELNKIFKENNYDVVHINMNNFANFIPLLTAKTNKIPKIILHAHNSGLDFGVLRIVLHYTSKFLSQKLKVDRLACSEKAGKWMFKNAPFTVLENSINHERFKYNEQTRKEIRNSLNVKDDEFLIGTVGRVVNQKNHQYLVKIFSVYHKLNPNSKLLIVGDGNLKKEIEKQIRELNLEDFVIMTGFIQDTAPYYQAMDLFCLPSIYEGLGIVGIEAQVSGLPCIFSERCVDELKITDNVEFASLGDDLLWLALMSEYSSKRIDRSKKVERYNIKTTVKQLEKIYGRGEE